MDRKSSPEKSPSLDIQDTLSVSCSPLSKLDCGVYSLSEELSLELILPQVETTTAIG
jgi:hypothetical protein